MKNELKTFKCHICGTIIIIDKNTVKCENCGNSYVLENGSWFRENMWSKWRDEIRGKNNGKKNGKSKTYGRKNERIRIQS